VTIAYDLRYADAHFTGIGTHAHALLKALLDLPGDERYLVLWNPDGRDRYGVESLRAHPRVRWEERRIPALHPFGPIALGSWLRRERPAVYYSPFYLLPVGSPCPAVLTIHDVWPLRMPEGLSPIRRVLYRASIRRARRARAVVTSSRFSRSEIVALVGIPESRVHAIRLGVPPMADSRAPERPEQLPDRPFALVVGDNRPRKNLSILAEAWARMGPGPPLMLVSAGPADNRYPTLAEFATRRGARDVVGLGWVDEARLAWLYAHATVVLFPTIYEGFGFPLVEAFVRGLPVVASDIPTLREIGEGVASFVDPHDAAAWQRSVTDVAARPDEARRMRDAGRRRASELPYRHTAEATLEVLREAVGSS
jgi:glycosyltransferase involved in cell wall biosynthesis